MPLRPWWFLALLVTGCAAEATSSDPQPRDTESASTEGGSIAKVKKSEACKKVSDTETTCDGKDDDCNGLIDDVDMGQDGICDCLHIGLVGKPGYYGSNDFQAWLASKGTTVTRIQETDGETLTAKSLGSFDMVIVDWLQRAYTDDETTVFSKWLSAGHGALALSGFREDYPIEYPNAFLAPFGLAFSSAATLSGKASVTDFTPNTVTNGVSDVTFYGGSEVLMQSNAKKATPLARVDGRNVSVAVEDDGARVLAWGDEWIEFDSEWQTKPDIARLWANMISFLAPRCTVPPPVK